MITNTAYSVNPKPHTSVQLIMIISEYFIFQCKVQNRIPHVELFINVLKNRIEIELQIALKHDELHKFQTKYELLMWPKSTHYSIMLQIFYNSENP